MSPTEEKQASWAIFNSTTLFPWSIILLIIVAALSVGFFIVSGIRRLKHEKSATTNVAIAKRMQHFQIWIYSFFHTLVYVTTVFMAVEFVTGCREISAILIFLLVLVATGVSTQIDVVGTVGRKPGANEFSPLIFAQYLTTSYLAKAVWKSAGHPTELKTTVDKPKNALEAINEIFCFGSGPINNNIMPRVYDVKDVVGIQGAYLSLPVLAVYLMTLLRDPEGRENAPFYEDNLLFWVALPITVLSALLPPALGDWEYFTHDAEYKGLTSVMHSISSLILRAAELVGKLGLYIFLFDQTNYKGLVMFVVEWFLMYATYVNSQDAPVGGRVYAGSHYILSSFESVFYSFYRRISVDKQFVTHGNVMSPSIELFRWAFRSILTCVGYGLIYAGVPYEGCLNTLLLVVTICSGVSGVWVFFDILVSRRDELDLKCEFKRLKNYWKTWWFCRTFLCCPNTAYVNRDKNIGGTPGNNFSYV